MHYCFSSTNPLNYTLSMYLTGHAATKHVLKYLEEDARYVFCLGRDYTIPHINVHLEQVKWFTCRVRALVLPNMSDL